MKSTFALPFLALVSSVLSCDSHNNYRPLRVRRGEEDPKAKSKSKDWAYEASFNWNKINPDYELCQTGTQQSPIALGFGNGLSLNHQIEFDYPKNVTGNLYNSGYGPAFTVTNDGDSFDQNPAITFDNETVYLSGWHIHAPADHTVAGYRSKAEMHFVHVDAAGNPKAVLGFRIDPGNKADAFFSQLPKMVGFNDTETEVEINLDLNLALDAVLHFNEFWTYQGSLTSPPCAEGIRWFVARQILFTNVEQMQAILRASTYSAREEQQVWQHRINE